MVKLKVYHTIKHDSHAVSEFEITVSASDWVFNATHVGGFWANGGFVPWHKVNSVEVDIGG